jgi:hypothetical protein
MPDAEGAGTRRLGQRFVADPRCLRTLERFDEVATPALQLGNSPSKLDPLKTRHLHIYAKKTVVKELLIVCEELKKQRSVKRFVSLEGCPKLKAPERGGSVNAFDAVASEAACSLSLSSRAKKRDPHF